MSLNKKIVGKKIKALRKSLKLTQIGFAKKVKYTQGQVSNIERGDHLPSIKMFSTLHKLYGINSTEFLAMPLSKIEGLVLTKSL